MRFKLIIVSVYLILACVPVFCQETTELDSLLQERYRYYDEPIDPDIYLIRPGEKLIITFLKAKIPAFWLQVNPEGRIVEKSLGVFELAGKTLTEIRQLLHDPLQKLYNVEEFEISVREPYKVSVIVTGQVAQPGMYVGYTSMRVSEIVEMAGGVAAGGSTRKIIFCSDRNRLSVDLDRMQYLGDNRYNPCLYAGSRLEVPSRSQNTVTVIGEVRHPRTIELLPDDSLALLLALAGGVRDIADSDKVYAITEPGRDIKRPGNILSDDIIMVPAAPEMGNKVEIYGAVTKPGRYPLKAEMTLRELLAEAGSIQDNANKSGIVIFRKSQNSYWRGSARKVYPVAAGVGSSGDIASTRLLEGDSVFVPVLQGFVRVSGAVRHPGFYPYKEGKSVQYYLDLAGGFSLNADREQIRITDNIAGTTIHGSLGTLVKDSDEVTVLREEIK